MTIIFDFDGTIADSFEYVADFLLQESKITVVDDDTKDVLRGRSMQAMARQLGFKWWQMPNLFVKGRRVMSGHLSKLEPFAEMHEIIRKLHAEGHELFILSSNSKSNIEAFLHKYEMNTYFTEIYGNVGIFGKAPVLRKLLKQQHIELKDAIYVGDELRDAEASQSIGMRIISVLWGFARPEDLKRINPKRLAKTPQDILSLLS